MRRLDDPTDLPAIFAAEEAAKTARELTLSEARKDVSRLMAADWGRRVVRRLLESNFFYRTHASNNGVESQRAEGRRQAVLELRDFIESVCPERLIEMDADALKNRKDREQANGD